MDKKTISTRVTAVLFALTCCAPSAYAAAPPPSKGGPPGGPGGGTPPPMSVEAAQVVISPVSEEVTAVGSLQANESVIIRSEIAGRITTIHFKEGQAVKQGALLFSLDAAEYQAQLAQSSVLVKLNEINYNRAKDLRDKSLISQQEYDDTAGKLEEMRAKLALDQTRLDKASIRAPFNGVLGVRIVSPGAYIKPGEDLVTLEDTDPIKVEFRIPETWARQAKSGQRVAVHVDAYPDESYSGQVYTIDTRMDPQTRTLLLLARIANPKKTLRPGMFARVALILSTRSNALVVPEQAVFPFGQDQFVYRIVDGKAVQTKVQPGRRADGKVEIKAGVSAQDLVITAGQMKVRDGMAVAPLSGKALPAAPAAGAQAAGQKP